MPGKNEKQSAIRLTFLLEYVLDIMCGIDCNKSYSYL